MWILENEGEAFGGKRLWLRPGKRYLFGRTVAEPGQLAIQGEKANTVSRKHVTITVDSLAEGAGQNLSSRSRVTIEDLGSKQGTTINGEKIKGQAYTLSQDLNTLKMGAYPAKFQISWFPVVLSYSFTSKQLQANPLAKLRAQLEQLDIKFISDYDIASTTHTVSKKRNTAKGLQALINGKYIVNDAFVTAIDEAAASHSHEAGVDTCLLEKDFDGNWPDATRYLPPPGDEPFTRTDDAFEPNPRRAEFFEGYTLISYSKPQYENLLDPITNGKGKLLLKEVTPNETQVDEFVRFVKEVAGEKGLGELEDGSDGQGVAVVAFTPSTGEHVQWYNDFYTEVSLRLDLRLIDQKEFLDAILGNDPTVLRRRLPVDSQPNSSRPEPSEGEPTPQELEAAEETRVGVTEQHQSAPPRRRVRGAKSRFRGFELAVDSDEDNGPASAPAGTVHSVETSQEGMSVSQEPSLAHAHSEGRIAATNNRDSRRKRPISPVLEAEQFDVMEGFAPTAAQVKRRRIETGEDPIPTKPSEPPLAQTQPESRELALQKVTAVKKEPDILEMALQHKKEVEDRARAEREELATAPEGLDLAEIRRLQIVEEIELRQPPELRTRDQDIADGRWDPSWNGRKNFKKFRQRGATQGRPTQKIIVQLDEVKAKAFGIGDDYWLEDESQRKKKKSQQKSQDSLSQPRPVSSTSISVNQNQDMSSKRSRGALSLSNMDSDASFDDEIEQDDEEDEEIAVPAAKKARTKAAAQKPSDSRRAQSSQHMQSGQPTNSTTRPQPGKRPTIIAIADSDEESDDELRFRFGRRR